MARSISSRIKKLRTLRRIRVNAGCLSLSLSLFFFQVRSPVAKIPALSRPMKSKLVAGYRTRPLAATPQAGSGENR